MADTIRLAAEGRTEFGKGAARRARMAHKIPAVLYGHGTDPVHVLLPGHDTMMALKHQNALINIDLPDTKHMAIARDVQRDPIKRTIEHVDLLIVRKGEKITVDVAIHLEGESAPGTIHILENSTLSIAAEATHLPEFVTVSIEGLEEGEKILAGDITLPEGSVLETDPEQLVVAVSVPRQAEELEAEEAEAAADAADGDVVPEVGEDAAEGDSGANE